MVADGMTETETLKAFPHLESADIQEALHYAAERCASANFRWRRRDRNRLYKT
jgi:uncharacterized protein (DUF433 family)